MKGGITKKEQEIETLKEFSGTNSTSESEEEFVRLFSTYTKNIVGITADGMLNVYAAEEENEGDRPVIRTDAHSDAAGFITQAIRPNDLVEFIPLDDWVKHNTSVLKIKIRNRDDEYIPGVTATKPSHLITAVERNSVPGVADMSIDVNSSSREETIKDYKIDTGYPIFVDVKCEHHEKSGLFFGKDFDDRFGAGAIVDVLDNLKGEETDFDIMAVLLSQEGAGLRRAYVTGRKTKPDLYIVLESRPADDTSELGWLSQTGLKCGPMLRDIDTTFSPDPKFQQYACDLADKNGMLYTRSVRIGGGQGGTAVRYEYGAPTIAIGTPVCYEHSPYCFLAYKDFGAPTDLAIAIIRDVT